MLSRIILTAFCLALAGVTAVSAVAPARYRFRSWTTDDGLPQNSVNAILQTRDGFLWCTTLDGLVRYDGVRFSVFDRAGDRNIRSNRFTDLCQDRTGAIWAGTEDGGIVRYRDGAFRAFTTDDGLPDDAVRMVVEDSAGSIFVTTPSGISKFEGDRFVPFALRSQEERFYIGRSGALWTIATGEVRRVQNGRTTTWRPPGPVTAAGVAVLREGRDGSLWYAFGDILYHTVGDAVTRYGSAEGLTCGNIGAIFEDRDGAVWAGGDRGLAVIRNGAAVPIGSPDAPIGVISIGQDREGTIWVGTVRRGLFRLTRAVVSIFSSKDGLGGDVVYPIYQTRDGTIWIGADGLSAYRGGAVKVYGRGDGLARELVMSICEDRTGRLWIGTVGGAFWFDGRRFEDITARVGLPVNNCNVWAITEDSSGTVWVGTDRGLYRYRDERFTRISTTDGLASDDVKTIVEDSKGALWIGTYGGLSVYRDGRFQNFTEADGLASNRVRCVHEDAQGRIWAGTYDGGLSRISDGRIATIAAAEGLSNNGVFQILDDGRGNFWMSSNRGIYRARIEDLDAVADGRARTLSCVAYGKDDGLTSIECNGGRQPSGIRARDGRLWFPTQAGVAVIDPNAVERNTLPPPVEIESIVLDRTRLPLGQTVRIEPGQRGLEISYAGLSFMQPELVTFRYMLENYDSDWIDAGTRRTAYYASLPPGHYTFVVRAANSDGVWNSDGASIEVVVVPPFWRTWWFLTLSLVAIVAVGFALYRRRIDALERAHAAQQAFSRQLIASQEQERKRIAAELHDGLGQRLVVIKNLALLALRKPGGDLPKLVEELSSETSLAIGEVKEISYNLRPYQLDRLGLTRAIESIVEAVSDASTVRFTSSIDNVDGCFSKEDEIGVYRIVQESVNNVVKHASASEASVAVVRDPARVEITIRDDGRGFVPGAAPAGNGRRGGFGLIGIAERVRMLGGRYTIDSAPGRGTVVRVEIDLGSTRDEQ